MPTAENPVGWRGDGSGKFPGAVPPAEWSLVSKDVSELKCSGKKPKGVEGIPMTDGAVHEWLVWGPSQKELLFEILPKEGELAPDDNETAGTSVWKLVKSDTNTLDLTRALKETGTIYAHTYIYSGSDKEYILQLAARDGAMFWLNGSKVVPKSVAERLKVKLKAGWNRFTFKAKYSKPGPNQSDGGWFINPVFYDTDLTRTVSKNIAWTTRLGKGFGSPVTVGDKIYVESNPDLLICLAKTTGRIIWVKTNNLFESFSEEEKKATPALNAAEEPAVKLRAACENLKGKAGIDQAAETEINTLAKQIHDISLKANPNKYNKPPSDFGYGSYSPSSDGNNVYVFFAHMVSACYDLEGNRKWIRFDDYNQIEHGISASPLLIGGKMVVYMRELLGLDAKTGEKSWVFKAAPLDGLNPVRMFYGSPVAGKIGGSKYIFLPDGRAINPADGSVVFDDAKYKLHKHNAASSAVDSGTVVRIWNFGPVSLYKLGAFDGKSLKLESKKDVPFSGAEFPRHYLDWHTASPLVVDGLAYLVNDQGILSIIDVQAGTMLYQKLLDVGQYENHGEGAGRGVGASPALGGKNIYITGNFGTTLVLKPGKKYEQLAKNKIMGYAVFPEATYRNHPEKFIASPYFDGGKIFIRGEQNLYCIGEGK